MDKFRVRRVQERGKLKDKFRVRGVQERGKLQDKFRVRGVQERGKLQSFGSTTTFGPILMWTLSFQSTERNG
jgi:hypothetical protein